MESVIFTTLTLLIIALIIQMEIDGKPIENYEEAESPVVEFEQIPSNENGNILMKNSQRLLKRNPFRDNYRIRKYNDTNQYSKSFKGYKDLANLMTYSRMFKTLDGHEETSNDDKKI